MFGATCLLMIVLDTAATAELPPPRPPAAPFPAEPPTAETVRRLHEMVPQDEGEAMSEEEMAANFQRFLDARGGRIEPSWANHSRAERTANLQRHHAQQRHGAGRRAGMDPPLGEVVDLLAVLVVPEVTVVYPSTHRRMKQQRGQKKTRASGRVHRRRSRPLQSRSPTR